MPVDPRVTKAMLKLASYIDGALWRVSSQEERRGGIDVSGEIQEILDEVEEEVRHG